MYTCVFVEEVLFYWRCRPLLSGKLKVCLGTCRARRSILLVLYFAPELAARLATEQERGGGAVDRGDFRPERRDRVRFGKILQIS